MRPVALVTGASSGIGLELARVLAGDGHDLVLVARSEGPLHALAAELAQRHGANATVVPADLAEADAAAEVAAAVAGHGLAVDVLVNNAGVGLLGAFAGADRDRQLAMLQLNITSLTDLTHRFLGGMLERGRGRIVNVASTAAFQPGPLMAVYYATKAYVLAFSLGLAEEVAGSGVTVTALCPGPTSTGFQRSSSFGERGEWVRNLPTPDAAAVAAAGWRGAVRGRGIVIPGVMNKLSAQGTRLLPRRAAARVAKRFHRTLA
jgi:short-subunit dehydrogenase